MTTNDSLRVLVCDDRPENLRFNSESIEAATAPLGTDVQVSTLTGTDFVDEIRALERRRGIAREGRLLTDSEVALQAPSRFDGYDIVILDYDLLKLQEAVDGETTAYRVRCYSAAPYIVVINETRVTNEFDLRMLPRLESSADLLCNSRDLGNRGLWSPATYGYRPWLWPVLPHALKVRRELVSVLVDNIDVPLVELMGMPEQVVNALPPDLVDVLSGDGRINDVTASSLARSELGYRRDDVPHTLEATARVAASALAAWVGRLVAAGQEHLTDVPHLLDRYPSLSGLSADVDLDETIRYLNSMVFASLPLRRDELDGLLLPPPFADRPMWWSRLLSRDRRILEVRSPSIAQRPPAVFCEDVSLFAPEEMAVPFIVDLPTRLKQRFVYGASSRSLQELELSAPDDVFGETCQVTREAESIEPVSYVPARRLLDG